jgi:hypothetical protein
MKLTERYVELCRELAEAGYVWNPRPGDWMLDLEDGSIGMLTMHIERPALIRRVNVQIPYGLQIAELLAARGCLWRDRDEGGRVWVDAGGAVLHECAAPALAESEDEEALVALVMDFRRNGAGNSGPQVPRMGE